MVENIYLKRHAWVKLYLFVINNLKYDPNLMADMYCFDYFQVETSMKQSHKRRKRDCMKNSIKPLNLHLRQINMFTFIFEYNKRTTRL